MTKQIIHRNSRFVVKRTRVQVSTEQSKIKYFVGAIGGENLLKFEGRGAAIETADELEHMGARR